MKGISQKNCFVGLFSVCFFASTVVFAQKNLGDTSVLDEIVVTATRTERKLSNVAIPTTVISNRVIQLSGSLRLNEILQEQSGLLLTSGSGSSAVGGGIFGNGIQMQGLSPDHTMILLDGEPLIGRQGGVMDLSRFAIGNIRKIEIVKGPSSSLYGSEAMGGVVNIITEPLQGKQLQATVRTGSFNSKDIALSGNYTGLKAAIYFYTNRNSSNGYDLNKSTPEKTVDPFYSYTNQLKFSYNFSPATKLIVSSRYYYSNQDSYYAINSPVLNVGGSGTVKDYNINPVLYHRFSHITKSQLRLYASGYSFVQQLDSIGSGKNYYADNFNQYFFRAENQTDIDCSKNNTFTFGGGYTLQKVNTSRYREPKQQHMYHAFAQDEWVFRNDLTIIAGLRYDYNSDFSSRLSPKLSANYKLTDKIQLNASYGAGFKAPDFRQLYLNFLNNAGDGYSIFGSSEFSVNHLIEQQQLGLVADILPAAYQIKSLKPEISNGFNLGAKLKAADKLSFDINFFRNDITNLINYLPVAINSNGTSIFSYVNVNSAFTQGAEINTSYQLFSYFKICGGYQYLQTADKDILQLIKNGKVYGRDIVNGTARLLTTTDYSGLLNRSKHMANFRMFYDNTKNGWSASLRFIYRSRWGVVDKDGNGFANMDAEFAPANLQINTTVAKKINAHFTAQLGINNLGNQTNAQYLPNTPGLNWFISMNYSFKK
jgi:outer membrane receptor for ferrienterochelin and colicins